MSDSLMLWYDADVCGWDHPSRTDGYKLYQEMDTVQHRCHQGVMGQEGLPSHPIGRPLDYVLA